MGIFSGVKDFSATMKSKHRAKQAQGKLVDVMNRKIGSPTIIGRKNYNTQADKLSSMVKSGNMVGTREYVRTQQEKLKMQVKGSFKKGGTVKKTGLYKLHKGEKVVPAKFNGGAYARAHKKHFGL